MNLTTLMKFGEHITEQTPIGERVLFGLQVVGIGMGVVFGVLVLLIGILQLFKLFSVKKPNKKTAGAPAPAATAAPSGAAPVASSEEEKIVAIATAAIAAARGKSECDFNVISIKKIVK